MINSQNLINDGLTSQCTNNKDIVWTYNQGVVLGGLVKLFKATGNTKLLEAGKAIANAVLNST